MRRLGATVLIAALALGACDRVPLLCRDTLTTGVPSPDGARVAELVVRDCHYTTGYTTHVALRPRDARRAGRTVAILSGAWEAGLMWKGPRRLVVLPDARAKVLYQQPSWDGVSLEYGRPGT
jgi:hypothetical protein